MHRCLKSDYNMRRLPSNREVGEQDGDVDTQRLSDQCTLFDGDAVFTAFNASIVGAADLTNFSELFLAATFSFPKFSQIISKIVIDFIW